MFMFLFLLLEICVFSLIFLVSLARKLSISLVFSKNKLLISLILFIVFNLFLLKQFGCFLTFIISFLQLALGLICSNFSSFLK